MQNINKSNRAGEITECVHYRRLEVYVLACIVCVEGEDHFNSLHHIVWDSAPTYVFPWLLTPFLTQTFFDRILCSLSVKGYARMGY